MKDPADQLREELFNVILRWSQESDVSLFEAIGALETLKHDLFTLLQK